LLISEGWLKCDGTVIPDPSPWSGETTPNLNGNGLFLRGANPEDILTMQEDAFQDHGHEVSDPGHSHNDAGHNHQYTDCGFNTILSDNADDRIVADTYNCPDHTTTTGYADISTDATMIQVHSANNGRSGTETRPKNMAVEWIIRVF
jgi:hypothetical protein